MDAALGLGLHETFRRRDVRLLSASCALNVCPVTIGNCHHFYDKTSSTGALQFNKFGYNLSLYGEMAAITYIKTEQNYSKYIFNEIISHNLQPIRNNESNIKYYWIIYKQLYNQKLKAFYYFFDTIYHSIPFTQCCLS